MSGFGHGNNLQLITGIFFTAAAAGFAVYALKHGGPRWCYVVAAMAAVPAALNLWEGFKK